MFERRVNIANDELSEFGLGLLLHHFILQHSAHNLPPTLKRLTLSCNKVRLSQPKLVESIGKILSSSISSITLLGLTNNPITSDALIQWIKFMNLSQSNLESIHLSSCQLGPDCVLPLREWLTNYKGGARLSKLALNGNNLSTLGCKKIASVIISGQSNLIEFDYMSNVVGPISSIRPEWREAMARMNSEKPAAAAEVNDDWEEELASALSRNKKVGIETRRIACNLLPIARILFGGNVRERTSDVAGEIIDSVGQLHLGSTTGSSTTPIINPPSQPSSLTPPSTIQTPFPFLRLPVELQINILRSIPLLTPSHYAHHYPPYHSSTPPPTKILDDGTLSSILTEQQFLAILAYATSAIKFEHEMSIATVKTRQGKVLDSWAHYFLKTTKCDRFMRRDR